uniref:Uncharacterized protein n=1 Tax=Arundo donax TaxID=35708 RepID=A0A0A9GXP1_ARUDO
MGCIYVCMALELVWQLPCLELATDKVVVTADQLEGAVRQTFLDEGVGLEVLEGHVHGLPFQDVALVVERQ